MANLYKSIKIFVQLAISVSILNCGTGSSNSNEIPRHLKEAMCAMRISEVMRFAHLQIPDDLFNMADTAKCLETKILETIQKYNKIKFIDITHAKDRVYYNFYVKISLEINGSLVEERIIITIKIQADIFDRMLYLEGVAGQRQNLQLNDENFHYFAQLNDEYLHYFYRNILWELYEIFDYISENNHNVGLISYEPTIMYNAKKLEVIKETHYLMLIISEFLCAYSTIKLTGHIKRDENSVYIIPLNIESGDATHTINIQVEDFSHMIYALAPKATLLGEPGDPSYKEGLNSRLNTEDCLSFNDHIFSELPKIFRYILWNNPIDLACYKPTISYKYKKCCIDITDLEYCFRKLQYPNPITPFILFQPLEEYPFILFQPPERYSRCALLCGFFRRFGALR